MHLEHEHDCGHTHDHPHTHELEHAHDHSHTAAPRDELIALMRYMVGHNVSHTNELKELAHKLAHTGDSEACAQILDAVQDYETGNQKLAASLDQLQKERFMMETAANAVEKQRIYQTSEMSFSA